MSKYGLLDLSNLPDCRALSDYGRCMRLTIYNCEGKECPFKQTREEEFVSLQFVYQRLASLDSSTQMHIAKKYYGGYMPWNEKPNV